MRPGDSLVRRGHHFIPVTLAQVFQYMRTYLHNAYSCTESKPSGKLERVLIILTMITIKMNDGRIKIKLKNE